MRGFYLNSGEAMCRYHDRRARSAACPFGEPPIESSRLIFFHRSPSMPGLETMQARVVRENLSRDRERGGLLRKYVARNFKRAPPNMWLVDMLPHQILMFTISGSPIKIHTRAESLSLFLIIVSPRSQAKSGGCQPKRVPQSTPKTVLLQNTHV